MVSVIHKSWALLLGIFLLMIGNGLQGSLLGVRGAIEGFHPSMLSFVISAYFLGYLGGSRLAPKLIRDVGHVRVFAAMASMISAAFILYAALPDLVSWIVLRLVVGFCFACVYIVAESWLNDAADNRTRGKALALYMVVQNLGIVSAQGLLNLGDPGEYTLFVLISVLVSISFAPILLSTGPAPAIEPTARMTLRNLFRASPLGVVGSFLIGAVYAALFGMSAIFGTVRGLSVAEIASFVAAIYIGGICLQWPVGLISDRMDRRALIVVISGICAFACLALILWGGSIYSLYATAFVIGGTVNPLYALLIAHANDYLDPKDMPAASSGLIFIGGVGAIGGPVLVGQMMQFFGSEFYFVYVMACMTGIGVYAAFRMTRRPALSPEETGPVAIITTNAGAVAVEAAQEYASERMPESHRS